MSQFAVAFHVHRCHSRFGSVQPGQGIPGYLEAEAGSKPGAEQDEYSMYVFGAQFAEVRIDRDLRTIKVSRWVGAFDCGKVVNPKTARSQLIGGIVFGIGMALLEETRIDPEFGRAVNANIADYLGVSDIFLLPSELEAFGLAALVLAAVGIYGILAGSVVEQTREISVRAALGASRNTLFAWVVGRGMRLTALGTAIGLSITLFASHALLPLLSKLPGVAECVSRTVRGNVSFDAHCAIIDQPVPLETAMKRAAEFLARSAARSARLIQLGNRL